VTGGDRAARLAAVAEEARACTRCPLAASRTQAVPGDGSPDAGILFIGEAPGYHEDRQGRPFVGAAGKLLDDLLAGIGLRREDVFVTNTVKCRPPGNRDPVPEELEACRPFLDRQIEAIEPRIVVTLGRFAMECFLPGAKISQVHGQARRIGGRQFVPIVHPAAALHRGDWRPMLEADFAALGAILAAPDEGAGDDEPPDESAEQLSLF
jgi:DNA polymerase